MYKTIYYLVETANCFFWVKLIILAVVCLCMFKDLCLCRINLSIFWTEEQHMNYLSMISY